MLYPSPETQDMLPVRPRECVKGGVDFVCSNCNKHIILLIRIILFQVGLRISRLRYYVVIIRAATGGTLMKVIIFSFDKRLIEEPLCHNAITVMVARSC